MSKDKTTAKKVESLVICICGMAGSGKSTAARRLAENSGFKYYSGGDALKALALEKGYRNVECGWWESSQGMRFLEKRTKDRNFDEAIDRKLLKVAQKENVVLDSWTMPWLLEKGFKIWLMASPKKRAERVAKRDGISFEQALRAVNNKEKQTRNIYRRIYGFNLGEDFSPFHLILDTDNLKAEEVFQILCTVVDKCVLKQSHGKHRKTF